MLLVTTALEETWGKDQEILFLGEWCKLYKRKGVWAKRNSKTLADPWSNREKRFEAYEITEKIYFKFIQSLSGELNKIHKVDYPVRYWKILCGPWLRLFINTTYYKWECISDLINKFESIETIVLDVNFETQIPNDMMDFENKMISDYWNHYISTLVIESIKPNIILEKIKISSNERHNNFFPKESKIRRLAWTYLNFFGRLINAKNSIFISNSYLSNLNKIKLAIKMRSLPSFGVIKMYKNGYEPNIEVRSDIISSILNLSTYEVFLKDILLKNIPYVYIEGFKDLNYSVNRNKWQKNPRAIVTAVDHFSNDVFKCYAAIKMLNGAKINILCHGGGGKYKFSDYQSLELDLCDNYFTWGWSEYSSKCIKGYFLKNNGYKRVGNKDENYLLHILYSKFRYQKFIDSSPSYEQYLGKYLPSQIEFILKIGDYSNIRSIVKLSYDYENKIEERINERCLDVNYARSSDNYNNLLINAKLVVTTYNCTTPVESIAMNIPTIIFWFPEHWELAPSATPLFDRLRACGVFHDSPESAALMVKKVWSNIDHWWLSNEVQCACTEFKAWFSRESSRPIDELADFCNAQ